MLLAKSGHNLVLMTRGTSLGGLGSPCLPPIPLKQGRLHLPVRLHWVFSLFCLYGGAQLLNGQQTDMAGSTAS